MKEFFAYFFGQGEEIEFQNFTLAHFLPIIVAAVIIFVIYRFRNRLQDTKFDKNFRYVLAILMIVCEMSYFWRLVGVPSLGANPIDHLPITVCGWAIILGSYMMVTKCQSFFDIAYFWVFSGTIFALVTPTVISNTGPTRYRYYQFWAEHLLGYIAVFYMIFVHKMRPNIRSFVKAYVAMAVLAVIAFNANRMLGPGANYLFMAAPESTPSVLDILPPNFALRIVIMAGVISLLFFLSYLPWFLRDRKTKKAQLLKGETL